MVPVGNKTYLHLNCMGSGEITFILGKKKKKKIIFILIKTKNKTGHLQGGSSQDWRWVQPSISNFTRVCSYDRAGYGW